MDASGLDNRTLRLRLWQFVKPYRRRYALGLLCGVFSTILMAAYVELMQRSMDSVDPSQTRSPALFRGIPQQARDDLLGRLRAPRDPVSQHLRTRLSPALRQRLSRTAGPAGTRDRLLTEAMGWLLRDPALYDRRVFAGVGLRRETRSLLARAATDEERVRANRLLLEDTYPGLIARTRERRFAPELLVLILLVMVLRGFFVWAQHTLVAWSGLRAVMDLRNAVYERIQSLSLSYFETRPTGQLISRLTTDMGVMQSGLVGNVNRAVEAPILIVVGTAVITWKSPLLAVLLVLAVPVINTVIRRAGRRMKRATEQINAAYADLTQVLEETISGARVVKSFTMEDEEIRRFRKLSRHIFGSVMKSVRVTATLQPAIEVTAAVGFLLILGVSMMQIASGAMSFSVLIVLVFWVDRVRTSWQRLGDIVLVYNSTLTSASHAFKILDETPQVDDAPDAVPMPAIRGTLEFDRVSFSYNAEVPVLRDISFQVAPGECVALVGLSGAGKTTLVNLVPRFYDPTSGVIRVDGWDLRSVTIRSLRKQIGIVPQETVLFSGSVLDNIAYGTPGATREQVAEAARVANAHEFIQQLPEGYDTLVGERGAKLSGGQRQRLAIARAILRNPRILILDEATSALDTESEHLVQQALEVLMRGRTTLIIAHRLSTIRGADRILVLQDGRLAEEGSHDELMSADGLYSRLHQIQFEGTKTALNG